MKQFSDLVGHTLIGVERNTGDNDTLSFRLRDGTAILYHSQDCCESVYIEDINGDLDDLVGSPILRAEESVSRPDDISDYESQTWTFYIIATIKGTVTIRWIGSSNGYYSESVSFDFRKNRFGGGNP